MSLLTDHECIIGTISISANMVLIRIVCYLWYDWTGHIIIIRSIFRTPLCLFQITKDLQILTDCILKGNIMKFKWHWYDYILEFCGPFDGKHNG